MIGSGLTRQRFRLASGAFSARVRDTAPDYILAATLASQQLNSAAWARSLHQIGVQTGNFTLEVRSRMAPQAEIPTSG